MKYFLPKVKDYENDDIEIILEDKEHIMRIYNGDTTATNSYRILNIIGALILSWCDTRSCACGARVAKLKHKNELLRLLRFIS